MNLKQKTWAGFWAALLAAGIAHDSLAAGRPITQSAEVIGIESLTTSSVSTTQLITPTGWALQDELCVTNTAASSKTVWYSSFSVTTDTQTLTTAVNTGSAWPLYGGEKECLTYQQTVQGIHFFHVANEAGYVVKMKRSR